MNSDNFVVIQGWMCNELELKGNDLLVFALIYGFSQDGVSRFSGGRKYIAETFNISLPTVDKALQNLISLDYVNKCSTNDFIHTDTYGVNIEVVKNLYQGVVKKLEGGSKETLLNNIVKQESKSKIKNNSNELLQIHEEIKTSKKPNLYSKCLSSIDSYTSDLELREQLKVMLDLRLEIARDEKKQFYFSMWTHLLKELTDLGGKTNTELGLQIVLNSTSHGWKHFYEITDNQYVRNTRPAKQRLEQLSGITNTNIDNKNDFKEAIRNGSGTKF